MGCLLLITNQIRQLPYGLWQLDKHAWRLHDTRASLSSKMHSMKEAQLEFQRLQYISERIFRSIFCSPSLPWA